MKDNITVADLAYLGSAEWQNVSKEAVRRYNAHDELVALLDEALFQLANERPAAEREKYIALVNAALAKARGEA